MVSWNQKCLKVAQPLAKENHPEYLILLNNMALTYQELGLYEEALKLNLYQKLKHALEKSTYLMPYHLII